jgi:hypothetical protein
MVQRIEPDPDTATLSWIDCFVSLTGGAVGGCLALLVVAATTFPDLGFISPGGLLCGTATGAFTGLWPGLCARLEWGPGRYRLLFIVGSIAGAIYTGIAVAALGQGASC